MKWARAWAVVVASALGCGGSQGSPDSGVGRDAAADDSGACRLNIECGAPIDDLPCMVMSTCPCSFFEPTCVEGGCTVREYVICR